MILLTPDQANHVRGLTVEGHALAPALLITGNFSLPEEVLNDPYHAVHKAYLQANCLFVADIGAGGYEQDPALTAPYTYSSDWPPGEIIVVVP